MKITITYEYDPKQEPHYFSKATLQSGDTVYRGGNSWEEARRRMIETIEKTSKASSVPEPEEYEVE